MLVSPSDENTLPRDSYALQVRTPNHESAWIELNYRKYTFSKLENAMYGDVRRVERVYQRSILGRLRYFKPEQSNSDDVVVIKTIIKSRLSGGEDYSGRSGGGSLLSHVY